MSPSDELLRPALELAFAVALAGTKLRPPISPPPQLRPYLKFQKLPTGALPVVRKVVEDDDEFRVRTARVATEELAGRLGVIWLTRREGWVEEVQALVEEALLADPADDEPALRRADRRREAAELAAHRAQAEIAVARADAERERDRRLDAERRLRAVETELADQRRIAAQVSDEARATKARGTSAVAAAEELRSTNQRLRQRVTELEAALDDALAARLEAEIERDTPVVDHRPAPAGPSRVELDRAAGALHEAARAIRQLAGALDTTGAALAVPDSDGPVPPVVAEVRERAVTPRRQGLRRTPLAIPGGLFGDSDAVAGHFVRQTGVTLLVDGYNVAKLGWPSLTLEQQRETLLDGLETLVRRSGVRTIVFFDGADLPSSSSARRRLVRVRFTSAGVSADDAIRAQLSELPASRPVVVATNDQAIVRDVRADGANVVTSDQLLALLRR